MKSIGIYHKIDLEILDAVAMLRAHSTDSALAREEIAGSLTLSGIGLKTVTKRTQPALKSWFDLESPIVARAAELFVSSSHEDRMGLHVGVLFCSYPFFFDVCNQIGVAVRLGQHVQQQIVLDRLGRTYSHGESLKQATRKVLQTLVSWSLLKKSRTKGEYELGWRFEVSRDVGEIVIAGALEASGRSSIRLLEASRLPALFAFRLPPMETRELRILASHIEGSGDEYVIVGGG